MRADSRKSSGFASVFCLQPHVLILLLFFGLMSAAGPVFGQGPGLYKDGKRVLDLREAVHDLPAIDKSGAKPETPGRNLFRQVMGPLGMQPSRPFEDYLKLAERCRVIVLGMEIGVSSDETARHLIELESGLLSANDRVASHLTALRERLGTQQGMSGKIARIEELERNHLPRAEELLNYLADLREAHLGGHLFTQDGAIRDLGRYFDMAPFQKVAPPVDEGFRPLPMNVSEPTIRHDDLAAKGMRAVYPPVDRAYATADPADLAATIDVQLTPEIIALADSLDNSPVDIYYYVRDLFEFEAYLGSRKGSAQTLVHKAGNDYDQASLLIALLRASGVPARYATGRVYMDIDRAMNWLGFANKRQAGSLLTTAGMQGTIHIVNSDTTAISCQRVWVEAYIPFANYRGAVNDSTGMMWIPMDPAYKQHDIQWGYNLPADMGFDAEAWVEDYYSTFRPVTPSEKFEADLAAEMGSYYAGASLENLVDRKAVVLEPDGILPGTLPYELLAFDGTFSELTASQRYGIRFHVYGGGTDLDYSTTLPDIALKQVTISYEGATPADQAIIDAAGGVFGVSDPYLVDVVPLLKIDGCVVATGTGSVMMGTTHYSDMHFTAPVGASNQMPIVSNVIQAGNYQGIGIDSGDALPVLFGSVETTCFEELLGQELHQTALTYLNNVDTAEDKVAGYLHNVLLNDVSEAIVENAVTVMMSGSLPVTFTWNGMIVDADRKIIGPFATDGRAAPCQHMRIAGADGSFQENRVFELRYDEEAISTIKILGLAADSLITVCHIYDSVSECPGLNQPPAVISAINSALAQGHEVIIPQRQFKYFEWEGTAWIDIDPVTCAAGYIISGGHNGGATVQTWLIWWPGLNCLDPSGDITVEPVGAGPNNAYYAGDSNEHWTFVANDLRYLGRNSGDNPCNEIRKIDKRFTVWRYSIKQLAENPKFGPGEYVFRVGEPGTCPDCNEKELTVTIYRAELVSVTFTSDHDVLTDYTTDYSGSGGTVFNPSGWVAGGDNNPITHEKGNNISIDVGIRVEPAGIAYDLGGDGPITALDFNKPGCNSTGAEQTIAITSDGALPASVDVLNHGVTWKADIFGQPYPLEDSGPHEIYVTWGPPGIGPTEARVNYSCDIAKGSNSITAAAEKFKDRLSVTPGYSVPLYQPDPWPFLDSGDSGDCISLAKLARAALGMIGIPAQERWSYATADGTTGFPAVSASTCQNITYSNFEFNGEDFLARMVYPGNNFEAFFTVNDPLIKAYTVYPANGPFENQTYFYLEVLSSVTSDQFWIWHATQTTNGVTVNGWAEVPSEPHIPVPAVP